MLLEKIRVELEHNKISIADAIVKALPVLKDGQPDSVMSWLSNELQGYSHPLDFYYKDNHSFPDYRVVSGSLKLMNKEGNLVNLEHPLGNRPKYFLSVPISWLEESNSLPGEFVFTEIPELSPAKSSAEMVVIKYGRQELQKTLAEIKQRLQVLLK